MSLAEVEQLLKQEQHKAECESASEPELGKKRTFIEAFEQPESGIDEII
jgi:hypothetical protein